MLNVHVNAFKYDNDFNTYFIITALIKYLFYGIKILTWNKNGLRVIRNIFNSILDRDIHPEIK